MSAISRTLWFIESRFRTDLSLDDLAEATGLSATYLSRLFPMVTGYTVSGYLRARRLSEAARQLAAGATDILSVALDAGYGSHEAFTRAFRDHFGQTPEMVRKRGSLATLDLTEALRMDTVTAIALDPPRIERLPARRLAGLSARYRFADVARIPDQWQKANTLAAGMDGVIGPSGYGVVTGMADGAFDYLTAVEVAPDATLPRDFVVMQLPLMRWARFTHKGHVSAIRDTCEAIYGTWLPHNGAEMADGFGFLEYYGPGFDPRSGTGDIEIWVGLKD